MSGDKQWRDYALCNGSDTELFYDKYEASEAVAIAVDEMCTRCPVLKICSEQGMNNESGVWGAVFWNGSGRPDASRNAHKTEQVWSTIRERIKEQSV